MEKERLVVTIMDEIRVERLYPFEGEVILDDINGRWGLLVARTDKGQLAFYDIDGELIIYESYDDALAAGEPTEILAVIADYLLNDGE